MTKIKRKLLRQNKKAEYLAQNFGGQSRRTNSENLWLQTNTSAFGRPLIKCLRLVI